MASFIAVRGINARADKTVTDVIACSQGSLNIRAVVGIDVNSIVGAFLFGSFNQLRNYLIAVRAARVLATDGNLSLSALQAIAHTSPLIASVTPAGMLAEPP